MFYAILCRQGCQCAASHQVVTGSSDSERFCLAGGHLCVLCKRWAFGADAKQEIFRAGIRKKKEK